MTARAWTGPLGRVAVAGAVALAGSACIETAVSAGERMEIACEEFAVALEAGSERLQLDQLKEATHWADLAERKDEELDFAHEALSRLVHEAEDDLEDRDSRVVTEAVLQLTGECERYATPEVLARIRAGSLDLETLR